MSFKGINFYKESSDSLDGYEQIVAHNILNISASVRFSLFITGFKIIENLYVTCFIFYSIFSCVGYLGRHLKILDGRHQVMRKAHLGFLATCAKMYCTWHFKYFEKVSLIFLFAVGRSGYKYVLEYTDSVYIMKNLTKIVVWMK